jgi:cytochrome c-type biogenesis protein CcmH
MIWLVFGFLTLAAAMSVLLPLARARAEAGVSRDVADRAFYDSEIAGIDRDLARGLVTPADAEIARAEAARRLIHASEHGNAVRRSTTARRIAALASIVVIGGVALALYARLGSPDYRDQPLVARMTAPPEQMDLMAAVAKIEAHLAANPNDGRGRDVIAPVYMRMGRFEDAAAAWETAIRILGSTPQREIWRGEALTMAAQGKVTPDALAAFERALAMQPEASQAQFYVGLAAEQNGDRPRAAAIWTRLLETAPPGAPWADVVRERLTSIGVTPPAPRAADAIAALPSNERDTAIRGMVDGLATRLAEDSADVDGWLRLVRAYSVLKDTDKARTALADGRRALTADADGRAKLEALGRELGLGE